MYRSKSSYAVKIAAIAAGLLISMVSWRALVWCSGADGLPRFEGIQATAVVAHD